MLLVFFPHALLTMHGHRNIQKLNESSTVHTAIGICHTGYADCLLASSQHNLYVLLLMMDRKPVQNMNSSIPKINLRNRCISLVLS